MYNVKAVSTQVNVEASTLRAWERRYGVPAPPRTDSGYRLYSAKDIAVVRWLKTQVESGLNISQAVILLRSLQTNQQRQATPPSTLPSTQNYPSTDSILSIGHNPFQRFVNITFNCSLQFDETGFEAALNEAFALHSIEAVCTKIILPLQVAIGEGWHSGSVSINVEHFATQLIQRKLISLFAACPAPQDRRKIIAGCAPNEFHEIGILMLSLFLRRRGKDVVFLGQALSALRLEEMLSQTQPRMLLLSASTLQTAASMLDIVDVLRDKKVNNVLFAYGGRVFGALPELQKSVAGIYIGEDVQHAVDRIASLLDIDEPIPRRAGKMESNYRESLTEFRTQRANILAKVMHEMRSFPKFNYPFVEEVNQQFANTIEVGMRISNPALLNNPLAWQWHTRSVDGPSILQMQDQAECFKQAISETISPENRTMVEECINQLCMSLRG